MTQNNEPFAIDRELFTNLPDHPGHLYQFDYIPIYIVARVRFELTPYRF